MNITHDLPKEPRPIRVLLIVDSLYWVIGNFAHQITKNNPGIQAVTCSEFAIRKTVKRFGSFPTCFDIIHFLRTKTKQGFWGAFPIVTTFHHLNPATNLTPFHQSDAVMTVSNQWRQYLTQHGIPESRLALVPFGVDTDQFYPPQDGERLKIRKTLKFSKDAFVLGFSSRRISNIAERKGITCFLQALKMLRHELPNLATLIIGPGWQALAKDIRQQGIPCTQVPYQIDHEQVAKFYRAMDLFWVTSRVEGGPVPLLEAMATGIPCISTPVGAALDLIKDHKNGFMISFDSPDLFVKLSLQLAQDSELRHRIGDEARNTILRKRQWSQAQRKLQELYVLAIKNFYTCSKHSFSQKEIGEKGERNNRKTSGQKPMPAELFASNRVQNWIQACEKINGLQMMLGMREWKAASRFGFQALRTTPFDPSLWREIISVLLKSRKSTPPQPMYDETQTLLTPK